MECVGSQVRFRNIKNVVFPEKTGKLRLECSGRFVDMVLHGGSSFSEVFCVEVEKTITQKRFKGKEKMFDRETIQPPEIGNILN